MERTKSPKKSELAGGEDMGKRYYPTKLNEAAVLQLQTLGNTRQILFGILQEVVAIEERLINIEEKLAEKTN